MITLEAISGFNRIKGNFAPAESAQWYKFESVELNNGTDKRVGDSVGAVKRWYPKDPLDDVTEDMILQIISRIAQGDCKYSSQASKTKSSRKKADKSDRLDRPDFA